MFQLLTNFSATLLLIIAITLGSLIGVFSPERAEDLSSVVDVLIMILVSLLFFEISIGKLKEVRGNLRFLSLAWVVNFIIIPLIGWAIASLFLSGQPLLFTGLLIYFIAPCTDWFLGFTRLAKGDVALGSVLIPINLVSQLLLFPIYLGFFVGESAGVGMVEIISTLWQWFLAPFLITISLHEVLKRILPVAIFKSLLGITSSITPIVIAALVACICSGNINVILGNHSIFLLILVAVFTFFLVTYSFGKFISNRFQLAYREHALLTMTTAARNAPLMLGITTATFPDQPLIYAALIIGMLVEFPHLTALKYILLREREATASAEYPIAAPTSSNTITESY